ncbi:MAG: butyrate kinase [Porphyromonadaceae bacterium]|nr:MAG: butyrate kinase [Porphyromonadaceae bacterium]
MNPIEILVINPGSTSTKIAVFQNNRPVFQKSIKHSLEELKPFKRVTDQYEFRKEIILKELIDAGVDIGKISIIVGRGGLIKPIESGVYEVNQAMIDDLRSNMTVEHASNLGGLIAHDLASKITGVRAFIADPIVVDEFSELARFAGHPKFSRDSIFHALNQKAVARTYANSIGKKYTDLNLIVAHLGGGISVGAHEKGRVVDVNQGLDGEGPFSPERSGTLPVGQLITMCFSNQYTEEEIRKMVVGQGGLVAYLGTSAANKIEERIQNGDQYAKLVYEAMAYQVAKEIGACSVVLKGQVDAILITGGIAFNELFIQLLTYRIAWISQIRIFPGEDEMRALAINVLMVINGELEPKIYK